MGIHLLVFEIVGNHGDARHAGDAAKDGVPGIPSILGIPGIPIARSLCVARAQTNAKLI